MCHTVLFYTWTLCSISITWIFLCNLEVLFYNYSLFYHESVNKIIACTVNILGKQHGRIKRHSHTACYLIIAYENCSDKLLRYPQQTVMTVISKQILKFSRHKCSTENTTLSKHLQLLCIIYPWKHFFQWEHQFSTIIQNRNAPGCAQVSLHFFFQHSCRHPALTLQVLLMDSFMSLQGPKLLFICIV